MDYNYIKSLHIIFVVCWFAVMFYLPRLFIYFVEANEEEIVAKNVLQKQFLIMQKRLLFGIAWPAAIGTYVFGFWMIYENPLFLQQGWMMVKLCFVFFLTLYHLQCNLIYNQYKNGVIKLSSFKLRLFNEAATIILVAVVFIVELQHALNWIYAVFGLILFAVLLTLAIRLYRKLRIKKMSNNIPKTSTENEQ